MGQGLGKGWVERVLHRQGHRRDLSGKGRAGAGPWGMCMVREEIT